RAAAARGSDARLSKAGRRPGLPSTLSEVVHVAASWRGAFEHPDEPTARAIARAVEARRGAKLRGAWLPGPHCAVLVAPKNPIQSTGLGGVERANARWPGQSPTRSRDPPANPARCLPMNTRQ